MVHQRNKQILAESDGIVNIRPHCISPLTFTGSTWRHAWSTFWCNIYCREIFKSGLLFHVLGMSGEAIEAKQTPDPHNVRFLTCFKGNRVFNQKLQIGHFGGWSICPMVIPENIHTLWWVERAFPHPSPILPLEIPKYSLFQALKIKRKLLTLHYLLTFTR